MSRFDRTDEKTRRAKRLRIDMTGAERRLWRALRRKQLEGLKFRRQHPVGPYILDFYCPEVGLCIEVDGGQHNEPKEIQRDEKRRQFLESKDINQKILLSCAYGITMFSVILMALSNQFWIRR